MEIDIKKPYAVITGDFIGFSDLPAAVRKEMYFILKAGGRDLSEAFPGIMPFELDMFRGDGWQMLITDPAFSLRAALYVRAYVKAYAPETAVDLRLAIGIGPIDYVPEGRVSAGDGPAFRLSGKLLDGMTSPKSGSMRLAVAGRSDGLLLDALVRMIGEVADRWTARQSLAATGALKGWPRSRISTLWENPISIRAVGKHLDRADWHAVDHGLRAFEEALAV